LDVREYLVDFSTTGLLKMHKALRDAFDIDEKTPSNEEKPYGVRIHADWRQWSDALEDVLKDRDEDFVPVPWDTA